MCAQLALSLGSSGINTTAVSSSSSSAAQVGCRQLQKEVTSNVSSGLINTGVNVSVSRAGGLRIQHCVQGLPFAETGTQLDQRLV